ncbi:MAG: response regulator [Candidatus Scalindua sediminis]|nr:response regulator [Candidatus Scalindua sediminis]
MTNRILLVDDEETLRFVLRETLISEGYSVDVANDGFQALERVKDKSYDLLITDIKMHGMDGLQLIREIKRNGSHLKIIIITAYGSLEMVKEAARLGVIEFVSKPFKIQEIKDVITRNLCDDNTSSENDSSVKQFQIKNSEQLADNLLVPAGLQYYFAGPASQPKSTVVFDFVAINDNRAALIFGNVDGQNEKHREWWENKQIGVMIKTLFRSKVRNTPKKIVDDINTFLHKNIQPHIDMSILCALIDKRKRIIRYVNYGKSLVCSIFDQDGQMEIMESFPYLLGIYPEIEISERSIPYSHGSKLVLSSSNTISKIMEKGELIKQMVENILQSVKSSRKKESKEIDLCSLRTGEKEINFDDETILLIDLDWNHTTFSTQDEKCK